MVWRRIVWSKTFFARFSHTAPLFKNIFLRHCLLHATDFSSYTYVTIKFYSWLLSQKELVAYLPIFISGLLFSTLLLLLLHLYSSWNRRWTNDWMGGTSLTWDSVKKRTKHQGLCPLQAVLLFLVSQIALHGLAGGISDSIGILINFNIHTLIRVYKQLRILKIWGNFQTHMAREI